MQYDLQTPACWKRPTTSNENLERAIENTRAKIAACFDGTKRIPACLKPPMTDDATEVRGRVV